MKLWLPLFFCLLVTGVFAQDKTVTGIIFDKESKARIARVNILNIGTGVSVYDNLKGEFKIAANPGDLLIFNKQDHHSDTLRVKNYTPLAVYLSPVAIQLQQVTIRDTLLNPQKRLAAVKNEYSKIYGSLSNHDLLTSSPGAGAGIGIDALYNIFSRSGRNAAHLQEIIDANYKQTVIDYRFNKTFVASITYLKDPQLTDFMFKYRPGYYLVTTANDYDFILSIRANLKRYLRHPKAFELAPLPHLTISQ